MPHLEGLYREGMHVVPLFDNDRPRIRVTVNFGQVELTVDQASMLVGLLEGALEQLGNSELDSA